MTHELDVFDVAHPIESRAISLRADESEWGDFFGLRSGIDNPLALPAVWGCVSLIADTVSILPLRLYSERNGIGEPQPQHPLSRLLRRPNPISNGYTFRRALALSLAAYGNAYAYIERDGMGVPRALFFIPKHCVTIQEMTDGQLEYHVIVRPDRKITITAYEMLHVVGSTLDGKRGVSPITMHRHLYEHDFAQFDYGSAFFERGARVSGFLTTDRKLDAQQKDELREAFSAQHGRGGLAAGKVAVLSNGLTWQAADVVSPSNADYIAARKMSATEICMIWRVPPPLIGLLENATLANVESLQRAFLQTTAGPYLDAIEAELGRKLISDRNSGLYFEHDSSRILRGSPKEQAELNRIRINGGWVSRNEVRQTENMPPAEGLDDYLAPANMNIVGEEPEEPPPPEAPPGDPQLDAGDRPSEGERAIWTVTSDRWVA
jgi:HK97 family phage portal protein